MLCVLVYLKETFGVVKPLLDRRKAPESEWGLQYACMHPVRMGKRVLWGRNTMILSADCVSPGAARGRAQHHDVREALLLRQQNGGAVLGVARAIVVSAKRADRAAQRALLDLVRRAPLEDKVVLRAVAQLAPGSWGHAFAFWLHGLDFANDPYFGSACAYIA